MNSYFRYIFLLVVASICILAFLPYKYFPEKILKNIPNEFRYGDLYRLSNLPQFKQKAVKCETFKTSKKENTEIYIIGDSFLEPERIGKEDFGVNYLFFTHWKDKKDVLLDKSKKNILIIESVERGVRQHFSKEINNLIVLEKPKRIDEEPKKKSDFEALISSQRLNEKFETLLFSNDFVLKLKEIKACLNYKFFGRTSKDVVVSENGKHIFTNLDDDAFVEISDKQIDSIVENLNLSVEKYKNLGFEKVIISVIPNKTSILDQNRGKYNHLIERLQKRQDLKIELVDIYSDFLKKKNAVYDLSDSHWSCEGRKVWLEKADILIRN